MSVLGSFRGRDAYEEHFQTVEISESYVKVCNNLMVSLQACHPLIRQLNFITTNCKQKVDKFADEMTLERPFNQYIL